MKHEPRPAIHMEKQLGWAHKSGRAESLGISNVGQILLARSMVSQIWHQPAGSMGLWGKGSEKGQWLLLAPMSDTPACPSMPLCPSSCHPGADAQRE